jgi:type II secretory pathway component PulF
MSTKTAVRIAYATLALALVTAVVGTLSQGIPWWIWAVLALVTTGVVTVHILARRADLM